MDFYIQASGILTKLDNKAGSIKGLTLQTGDKNGPRLYALILETLKYRDVLNQVIKKSELLAKERKLAAQGNLSLVLCHDLLLNKSGIVANAGLYKDAIMRHKTRLNAEWIKAKIKMKVKNNTELAKVDSIFIPRWARINTLKISNAEIMSALSHFKIVDTLEALEKDCMYVDAHIDNLLAFHPQAPLGSNKYYLDGGLIFQNKASCIPAAVLAPPPGSIVIDACAAPGNKTSHLAAILNKTGQVHAFERDNKRVLVLREMLKKADADVRVTHGDFTRSDPDDPLFADVTHLLLDPSCSGSGIVNRLDYLTHTSKASEMEETSGSGDVNQDRLESLASFQLALLLHAMKFPAAQKITYSTCSVHAVENEHVVMAALRKNSDWKVTTRQEALPTWPHRGIAGECDGDEKIAQGLIRAEPGVLGTIGFFVACFVKRPQKPDSADLFVYDEVDEEESEGCDDDAKITSGTIGQNPGSKRKRAKKNKKKKKKQKVG